MGVEPERFPGPDDPGPDDDQVQFGPVRPPRWARLPRWNPLRRVLSRWGWARRPLARRLTVGVTALIVAVAAVVAGMTGTGTAPRHQSAGSAGSAHSVRSAHSARSAGPVTVKALGHPLLGEGGSGNWELLAVGGGWERGAESAVLVRVQPAEGTATVTRFPGLGSDGPLTILGTAGETIIHPWDFVPGYLVPDGRSARGLPAAMGKGGYVFPGPRTGEVWVEHGRGFPPVLRLLTMAGAEPSRETIRLQANGWMAVPDGQGYVLVQAPGGVYDARPDGLREVAAGDLVAAGREAWLVSDCPRAGRCVNTVIDPVTRTRRVLPGADDYGRPRPYWPPGTVCADGASAALLRIGPGRNGTVRLVSLRTGAEHDIAVGPVNESNSLVWSPDSRWLFTVASNGAIEAIDTRTGHLRDLGITLPPVTYLSDGVG